MTRRTRRRLVASKVALGACLCLSPGVCDAASDAARPAMPGEMVDAGGYRIHLYCRGAGSPTVVVASGGFSFDWGIVQPKVAQFARVCTYDPAGVAGSDPLPQGMKPTCTARVKELHTVLKNAGVAGPYVLVGFSAGGLVVRLYAARYPEEVSGMVVVDHAFLDTGGQAPGAAASPPPAGAPDSPPVLLSQTPISLDMEDDVNFSRLPERDQELHRWAVSIHSARATVEMAAACFAEVAHAETKDFPLGEKPMAVVSTSYDSPQYRDLQRQLLLLSHRSKAFLAENSSHMVIIDRPDVVLRAIESVVAAVRGASRLRE